MRKHEITARKYYSIVQRSAYCDLLLLIAIIVESHMNTAFLLQFLRNYRLFPQVKGFNPVDRQNN